MLTSHTLNSPQLSGAITVCYPNQLDNTSSPQSIPAPIVYFLQPRGNASIIFCRLFAWAFHRNSATQHMAICGGLLWTASISYFDYNSLVEGLSPPSSQGLPSLPTALFRQKGRLTKTLTSKQWQFSCSLMQTSLMASLIKGEGKTFSRSHGDHTYLPIYPPSILLHPHPALRWHFPPASFT